MDQPETPLIPLGDRAWLARFPDEPSARRWAFAVEAAGLPGVADVVLAYRSAAVYASVDYAHLDEIEATLRRILPAGDRTEAGRLHVISVLYDGVDLAEVASATGLDIGAVVALHSGRVYDVFAIGFQPGFPYLGYLDSPLDRLPRRSEPRLRVPAGSVAIAAGQTGIYPAELPGGWNLIGRTPLSIVDVHAGRFPIRAGDRVQFEPIGVEAYEARRGEPLP